MGKISYYKTNTQDKNSQNRSTNDRLLIVLLIVFIASSMFMFKSSITKAKNTTNLSSVISYPVQERLDNITVEFKNINGVNAAVTKLAKYQVAGRVVEEYDYTTGIASIVNALSNTDYYNDISNKDVAIAYGPMVLSENNSRMNYYMSGSRRVLYSIKDWSIEQDVGSLEKIGQYITNNHLIASDSKVNELIKKIDKDDFIQITGYLVRVEWKKGIYKYAIESSLERGDTGSGACEVILVEDVKWIK